MKSFKFLLLAFVTVFATDVRADSGLPTNVTGRYKYTSEIFNRRGEILERPKGTMIVLSTGSGGLEFRIYPHGRRIIINFTRNHNFNIMFVKNGHFSSRQKGSWSHHQTGRAGTIFTRSRDSGRGRVYQGDFSLGENMSVFTISLGEGLRQKFVAHPANPRN